MNHLVVCGLNYHSAPIAIRERVTIPSSCLGHALRALAQMPHIREAVVLSTCNRTEVYAVVSDVQAGLKEIESFFLATQTIADHEALKPNFKLLREDAALHLFRVASGLDSMVLGEGQIMAQVKEALQAAQTTGTAGTLLDQLFKLALGCGKRVRSETSLGRRAVSISSAAVELLRGRLEPLKDRSILVIGAGKMARLLVKHLLSEAGSGPIILINRGLARISRFLENNLPNRGRLKTGFSFEDRYKLAATVDAVVVSTSAAEYLLEPDKFATQVEGGRRVLVDISVPRNIDPRLAELPGVELYNADDLSAIVNRNLAERESLLSEAEELIFEALDAFHTWERSLLVVPTIAELRQKIEAIRLEQMEKSQASSSMQGPEAARQQLEEISRAIVNQILHHPTVQLKATRDYEILRQQAEALRTLFNLEALSAGEERRPRQRQEGTRGQGASQGRSSSPLPTGSRNPGTLSDGLASVKRGN